MCTTDQESHNCAKVIPVGFRPIRSSRLDACADPHSIGVTKKSYTWSYLDANWRH